MEYILFLCYYMIPIVLPANWNSVWFIQQFSGLSLGGMHDKMYDQVLPTLSITGCQMVSRHMLIAIKCPIVLE